MKYKKILSLFLALFMVFSLSIPIFASNTGYSTVKLTTVGSTEAVVSVQVPVVIPLSMDSEGVVTTSDDLKIINNSIDNAVNVISIQAEPLNNWSMVAYSEDFSEKADNTKEFAFALNNDEMEANGEFTLTDDAWIIEANSSLALDIVAKIPMQTEESNSDIARIGFSFEVIENLPEIECPKCLVAVGDVNEHKLDCEHYSCTNDNLTHTGADCGTDGHYNCDELEHIDCNFCGNPECTGEHGDGICGVIERTILNVSYNNGLMFPGSTNTALFSWTTNVDNNTLINLISSNPDVAEVQAVMSLGLGDEVEDEQSVTVNAKARGITTITGTLTSGETASFVVEVSELQNNTGSGEGAPSAEIEGAEDFGVGDSVKPEDVIVIIPIVSPDGVEDEIEVMPDNIIGGDSLIEGENEIIATVNINGTIINIIINIYIIPAIVCPKCEVNVVTTLEHKMDCGHYSCETNSLTHISAHCSINEHYNCDGLTHAECSLCGDVMCLGEHGEGICWIDKSIFSNNTWSEIILACQTNSVPSTWAVGDTKPMTINGREYNIQIIGKNHDTYTSGGKAPLTFQLAELYGTKYQMNPDNDNRTGWSGSLMRNTNLPIILSNMPSEIQSAIKPVNKQTLKGNYTGLETTSDKLFLLSEKEVFGTTSYSKGYSEGSRYAYYANGGNTIKTCNGAIYYWWLRGPDYVWYQVFSNVYTDGTLNNYYTAINNAGVAFGFCF